MVSLGHIAIDGSKFKANASDERSYDKKRINAAINKLLEQAERIDHCEDQLFGANNVGERLPKQLRQRKQRLEKRWQL
jgi:hypothetical protein